LISIIHILNYILHNVIQLEGLGLTRPDY
jgi:hypothetical protein